MLLAPSEVSRFTREMQWLSTVLDKDFERTPAVEARGAIAMTVGVIGGGTAGYLSALALARAFPGSRIVVVESPSIDPIGVGEATVPVMVKFLHSFLGVELRDFYEAVLPTWKLGIRFEWGRPGAYHFQAPFDWASNSGGILGSLAYDHSVNAMTFGSMLMEADRVPVFRVKGRHWTLLPRLPFAYHFDVRRLLIYLRSRIELTPNIEYRRDTVVNIVSDADNGSVSRLETTSGRALECDVYIDCSGFVSVLLEKAMGSSYHSYASSLLTDRAVVFTMNNGGSPRPYTVATTMDCGWTWTIPQRDSDHCGYVFASSFCSDDEARLEASRTFAGAQLGPIVRFRSGRHQYAWVKNVVGIGNSYAFVEPLESTGILMIIAATSTLIDMLPAWRRDPAVADMYNRRMGSLWDGLRWFLAVHYKFNRRRDSPFWRHVARHTDIGEAELLLRVFAGTAPLRLRDRATLRALQSLNETLFYGLAGYDCILLGQGVECVLAQSREDTSEWRKRHARLASFLPYALTHMQALEAAYEQPELVTAAFTDNGNWFAHLPYAS